MELKGNVVHFEIPPPYFLCIVFIIGSSCLYTAVCNTSFKMMESHGPFKSMTVSVSHPAGLLENDSMCPFY